MCKLLLLLCSSYSSHNVFDCVQTGHSDIDVIGLYLFSKSASQSPSVLRDRKCRPLPRQMQIMIENRDMDCVYNVSLKPVYHKLRL